MKRMTNAILSISIVAFLALTLGSTLANIVTNKVGIETLIHGKPYPATLSTDPLWLQHRAELSVDPLGDSAMQLLLSCTYFPTVCQAMTDWRDAHPTFLDHRWDYGLDVTATATLSFGIIILGIVLFKLIKKRQLN